MGRNRYNHRRHPSVMLDAGYVSIRTVDICTSPQLLGLHGKKSFYVIAIVVILFLVSFLNLMCLVYIMSKLDWTPFHKNGSRVFRFDKVNQRIELHNQGAFNEVVYTTKVSDDSKMNFMSNKSIDIYGDHNSVLFNDDQISINTEYFSLRQKYAIDFSNLQLFKFDRKKNTRVHLSKIDSDRIHDGYLNLTANNHLTISNVNGVLLSGRHLNINTQKRNYRSTVRFDSHSKQKKHLDRQQKVTTGNLNVRSDFIYLDLPRASFDKSISYSEANVYRLCICNTTRRLLQSFAHQPCPLC